MFAYPRASGDARLDARCHGRQPSESLAPRLSDDAASPWPPVGGRGRSPDAQADGMRAQLKSPATASGVPWSCRLAVRRLVPWNLWGPPSRRSRVRLVGSSAFAARWSWAASSPANPSPAGSRESRRRIATGFGAGGSGLMPRAEQAPADRADVPFHPSGMRRNGCRAHTVAVSRAPVRGGLT